MNWHATATRRGRFEYDQLMAARFTQLHFHPQGSLDSVVGITNDAVTYGKQTMYNGTDRQHAAHEQRH